MANVIGGTVVWNLDVDDSKLKSGLASARGAVQKAASDIGDSADQMGGKLSGLGNAFKEAEAGSMMFAGALAAVGAAGVAALGFGVKMAGDIEAMKQGFVTLLGSTQKADEALAMIKKDAATTPFTLMGLIQANQQLTSITKNAKQSESLLMDVGKALSAMGRGQPELDRMITNLQQIGAVGHASMLDIKQFAFAGIPIFDMLGEVAKKSGKDLGDMVKDHEITFELLTKLFHDAGTGQGQFANAFINQAGTFNQLLSNLQDNITIAASEIVKQSGVFDIVKNALAGLINFIGQNTPAAIALIKNFLAVATENAPILIGFIVGGLVPAFVALGASIWAAMAPLIPFIAAGVAIGFAVKLIIDALGGWQKAQTAVTDALKVFGDWYNALVKPAVDDLVKTIQNELLPNLREFWNIVSPLLVPVLKVLGAVIVGVILVALRLLVEQMKLVVAGVNFVLSIFNTLANFFMNLPNVIGNAMGGLRDALVRPFQDAWNGISGIINKIRDGLSYINPFAKHSPSLVENVTKGIGIIKDQYESLANMNLPAMSMGFPQMATAPALLGGQPTESPLMGGGSGVTVNIGEANIKDEQDIKALGREFGFRMALQK